MEATGESGDERRPRRKVLIVSSNGGHLAQLMMLRPWWGSLDRAFVTFRGDDSIELLAGEEAYWAYFPTTRNIRNLLRNTILSIKVLRRVRPDVIVSNGAGVAVPFFYVGRLMGIPTVYIEVFDRVTSATLTGRLCRPATSLLLLQWQEQREVYRRGEVIGPLY
jgi:UDP-N-acetylglucosamine:LPS N-acetylglucosamine transferase